MRADELRAPKNCAAEELTLAHEDARLGAAAEDRVELAHVLALVSGERVGVDGRATKLDAGDGELADLRQAAHAEPT